MDYSTEVNEMEMVTDGQLTTPTNNYDYADTSLQGYGSSLSMDDSAYGDSEGCSQSSEVSGSSGGPGRLQFVSTAQPTSSPMNPLFLSRGIRSCHFIRHASSAASGSHSETWPMSPRRLFGTDTEVEAQESPTGRPLASPSTKNPVRKSRAPWVDVSKLVTGRILVEDMNGKLDEMIDPYDLGAGVTLLSLESKDLTAVRSSTKRPASPGCEELAPVPVAKRVRRDPTLRSKSCTQIVNTGSNVAEERYIANAIGPMTNSCEYKTVGKHCSLGDAGAVMAAVHKLSSDPMVVGDCSDRYSLPILTNAEGARHRDLKEVSPKTVIELMNGKYRDTIESYHIIDCRYPYEYDGGHICNAKNLFTELMVSNHFLKNVAEERDSKRTVIIFHCEFSVERGPTMCRRLRAWDRNKHLLCFPRLHYPELYVLNGGYRRFYMELNSSPYCFPYAYQAMIDPTKTEELTLYKNQASAEFLGNDHWKEERATRKEKVTRPSRPLSFRIPSNS